MFTPFSEKSNPVNLPVNREGLHSFFYPIIIKLLLTDKKEVARKAEYILIKLQC